MARGCRPLRCRRGWLALAAAAALPWAAATGERRASPSSPEEVRSQRCTPEAADPKWAAYCRWAAACGMEGLENLYLGYFMKGGVAVRGLGVARDLEFGDVVFRSPGSCDPSTTDPEFQEIWGETYVKGGGCNRRQQFALYLAEEARKGGASRMAPFLAMLPTEEEYRGFHPAYRPPGPPHLPAETDIWRNFSKSFKVCYATYKALERPAHVTYDEGFLALVWARSRAVHEYRGQDLEYDMELIGDMCNAVEPDDINALEQSIKEADLVYDQRIAVRDLRAGEELLCEYHTDRYDPFEFFQIFGFVLPWDSYPRGKLHMCHGLRPHEFRDPGPNGDPIVRNFWVFATAYCHPRSLPRGYFLTPDQNDEDDAEVGTRVEDDAEDDEVAWGDEHDTGDKEDHSGDKEGDVEDDTAAPRDDEHDKEDQHDGDDDGDSGDTEVDVEGDTAAPRREFLEEPAHDDDGVLEEFRDDDDDEGEDDGKHQTLRVLPDDDDGESDGDFERDGDGEL